jgi:general secretion pathway protein G
MKHPLFLYLSYRSSRRGFTLFEMLLVLMIISLLMGLVIYSLSGVQGDAQRQKARADILTLREGLTAYQMECGTLPTTEQGLKALWSKPTIEPIPPHWSKQMDDEVLDPWGHPYQYLNPGKHNPDRYDLFSMGPDGQTDPTHIIGNWSDSAKP